MLDTTPPTPDTGLALPPENRGPPHGCDRLSADRADAVVTVLCDAFFDYPVMRYVLEDTSDYSGRLTTLIRLFVAARDNSNGLMLGLNDAAGMMAGGAMVDLPGKGGSTPAFDALRESVWEELGADARARYEAYGEASREHNHGPRASPSRHDRCTALTSRFRTRTNTAGARSRSGRGGSGSSGVSLTTELARNVTLYEHFGYEVSGSRASRPGTGDLVDVPAMLTPCGT